MRSMRQKRNDWTVSNHFLMSPQNATAGDAPRPTKQAKVTDGLTHPFWHRNHQRDRFASAGSERSEEDEREVGGTLVLSAFFLY